MKRYLVGGAVRDKLLGIQAKDKDYMFVGATPEQLIALGYEQVGKDFPVFLHPTTKQEHALARTETKIGEGYTGFVCHASPEVTLEQDLIRRDLTINAIAEDEQGHLHDPYQGIDDIHAKLLRHVSPAFNEDPLRVLRVARFAARFAHLGFSVAPETLELMTQMSSNGELNHLSPERVWQELSRALMESSPQVFIQVLKQVGALKVILPEVDALYGVPQTKKWHPEVDTGIHIELCLKQGAKLALSLEERFALLCHDLGKAFTPAEVLPGHKGHEQAGIEPTKALSQRLRVPKACQQLALLACEHHLRIHKAQELKASTIVKLFDSCDVWRQPERFERIINVAMADSQGRTGLENTPYPSKAYLLEALTEVQQVQVKDILALGYKGAEIKQQLWLKRVAMVKGFIDKQVE
ncbi:multifunctional CCA addition/repair protein [Paraferrimonas sp. SM1919]|uniref:multifunctional CCA addition/repair protein n=1 Tax=Paraferrimonas sp. SM1919 TaxID=2662263 RepID=UPI0013D3661C|nr:multifunctional CCA addition/repair protein [Paraferrimonas sp. SM1919]